MNPPPLPPDDGHPPPPPPTAPSPPPARDPLLDDPIFADLVGPGRPPAPAETPARTEPLFAETVGEEAADLPIAEPVRPPAAAEPVYAEPVGDEPPRARPVAPPRRSEPRPPFPPRTPRQLPETPAADPPKSQWFTACAVMGCLGVVVLAAIAFLIYVAISILAQLGDTISETDRSHATSARPGPITPTSFVRNSGSVPLGGECDLVGRGAGGRYLFFRIPAARTIAVFDANTGAIVHRVDGVERKALFAAGAAKLFVYEPAARAVERYDLITWEKEATVPLPAGRGNVDAIAVGPGSDGPVYAIATDGGHAAEVRTLDPDTLQQKVTYNFPRWGLGTILHARASDDGTVIGVSGPSGTAILRVKPGGIEPDPRIATDIRYTPSPDGEFVFSRRGVFKSDGTPVSEARRSYPVPTTQGSGLYLRLPTNGGRIEDGAPDLCFADTQAAAGSLPGVMLPTGFKADEPNTVPVPVEQRVYLWPAAGLAAVLPTTNDRLDLHKVDVASVLRASGRRGYAVFGSDPPKNAARGKEWKYTPEVWTPGPTKPPLTVRGPAGMRAVGGAVVWTPPADAEGPVEVTIGLVGSPAEQKFHIAVTDAEP
jgi:hypothetical protein